MPTSRERELWAVALKVENQHGNNGPRHIAEMIGKAALAGDDVGVGLGKLLPLSSTSCANLNSLYFAF